MQPEHCDGVSTAPILQNVSSSAANDIGSEKNFHHTEHQEILSYLLLELFMDSIQCILDGYTLHVPCSDLKPKWEVQVDLLDWRLCEHLLEHSRLIQCRW